MAFSLNPEQMLFGIIQKMGIGPDDIKQVVSLMQRMHAMLGEVDDFKSGTRAMVQHFNARLDNIEARLERIEHPPQVVAKLQLMNGSTDGHVRND